MKTREQQEFWREVDRSAREVDKWPAWLRGVPEVSKQKSPDDIWAQLESELGPTVSSRPPNSVTSEEFAARRGYNISHANHTLADMVKRGKMQRVKYRTEAGRWAYAYTIA